MFFSLPVLFTAAPLSLCHSVQTSLHPENRPQPHAGPEPLTASAYTLPLPCIFQSHLVSSLLIHSFMLNVPAFGPAPHKHAKFSLYSLNPTCFVKPPDTSNKTPASQPEVSWQKHGTGTSWGWQPQQALCTFLSNYHPNQTTPFSMSDAESQPVCSSSLSPTDPKGNVLSQTYLLMLHHLELDSCSSVYI